MLNKKERREVLAKLAEMTAYGLTAKESRAVHSSTMDFNRGMAWGLEVAAKAAGVPESVIWQVHEHVSAAVDAEHLPCKVQQCRKCKHCRVQEIAQDAAKVAEAEIARRKAQGY